MKFLFASDSFKGTLSSQQTVELLAKAARAVFGEDIQYSGVPVADGGEGTTDAVVAAENGSWVETLVHGPLMEPAKARYGRLDEHRACWKWRRPPACPWCPWTSGTPCAPPATAPAS